MVIDPDHAVSESDESDNEYTRTITVNHVSGVPNISSISPSSASAGTHSQVTITGTGFGTTQGSGQVEFFYQSGHAKILGTIISWSNTQIVCEVPIGTIDGYAASACSGPVTVRTSGGVSGGYDFTVTFSYDGHKWNTSSASYKINENYTPVTGEGAAVQAAFTTWTNAGANFSFQYGGTSSATTSSHDGANAILWGTTSGSLATNYGWYSGTTMLESDIVFNNTYTWGIGSNYDIQSIATHELGHALVLRDQYGNGDLSEIMYGQSASGAIKRTLSASEIDGILWIYGRVPTVANIKVFLQGPSSAGAMTTTLNTSGLIPLTSESAYAAGTYGYSASAVTSIPNTSIVDWLLVELRSDITGATKVAGRAGFLKNDGTVVDIDGASPLSFAGVSPGNYYVVVRHRNHLSIMSAAPIALSSTSALYDFKTAQTQAYGTNAMAALTGGAFGMIAGDVNQDGIVKYNLGGNDRALIYVRIGGGIVNNTVSGYYPEDVNLDGVVKYNLGDNDRGIIYVNIGSGAVNATVSTKVPN